MCIASSVSRFTNLRKFQRAFVLSLCIPLAGPLQAAPQAGTGADPGPRPANPEPALTDWPLIRSALAPDAGMEARIKAMVAAMTLPQKIGQMTQPEIKSVTPAQVREFYIGSVLNGGGSWPGGNKRASVQEWLALADQYYDASMSTDMSIKVPVIWGTDAVHGHNNVLGATVFPHNIGLGAAHDPALVRKIGGAVGKAVRATGIDWVFAPTLAVAQDSRWGRTYESFSEEGSLVRAYASAYTQGLQGMFREDGNVVATAKHFIGDGGTALGKDQGVNLSSLTAMINVHGKGYFGALSAGVQTVMASFNSWRDPKSGIDYGKMHGSREMLTGILKGKMGFDGFVVSDWNGIAQVPGCSNSRCAQAINAGIDMVMVPDDWREFIATTIAQVHSGEIPMARIDDAVTRILRVKMRAGMFDRRPSTGRYAGRTEAVLARPLARRAVQQSLVLLKNNRAILPLNKNQKILVVGKAANNMQTQTGGWTLTWQGTENADADFPSGDTILAGIRERAGAKNVVFSEDAAGVDPRRFDVVIAVIGETPYAEGNGDIPPADTLRHSSRYPQDRALLEAVARKGRPVITVLLSGRPVYANDLLNLSDAWVAAWLPGTEGKGIADVLFRTADGRINQDFRGRLSFSWPDRACPPATDAEGERSASLFRPGYGLSYRDSAAVGLLAEDQAASCADPTSLRIFGRGASLDYALYAAATTGRAFDVALGNDLNAVASLPAADPVIRVETAQVNTQQDARKVTWQGAARFLARSSRATSLLPFAARAGALKFEVAVFRKPQHPVLISMGCGPGCAGAFDATELFVNAAEQGRQVVKIPLACFAATGADLSRIAEPFDISTAAGLSAAFTNIEIVADAGNDADVAACRAKPAGNGVAK